METGKVTITFKKDTFDIELQDVDGLGMFMAAESIVKEIVEKLELPVPIVLEIIQSNIEAERAD